MEPGHEDREYMPPDRPFINEYAPQWSPVMKTGNTRMYDRVEAVIKGLNGARS